MPIARSLDQDGGGVNTSKRHARCTQPAGFPRWRRAGSPPFRVTLSGVAASLAVNGKLRRARQRAGLTLAQVAERLGATSVNAYARYEQGRSVPTVRKLTELFAAVRPGRDLVVIESDATS